jgi:hypothetical protein
MLKNREQPCLRMLERINYHKDRKRFLTYTLVVFVVSNARYKKFPASTLMIGYTGQVG